MTDLKWFEVRLILSDGVWQADTMFSPSSLDALIDSLECFKHSDETRTVVSASVKACEAPEGFPHD